MKRPDGFDSAPSVERTSPVDTQRAPRRRSTGSATSKATKSKAAPAVPASASPLSDPKRPVLGGSRPSPEAAASAPASSPKVIDESSDARSRRSAARDVRRAAAKRRRFERAEVRRFTRRRRHRRVTWAVVAGFVLTMVALVAVAVYSPLLALKTIDVQGASRIPSADILNAVDDQLDTPLGLLDFDRIEQQLGAFPLIRSYVTETIPPDTLVIHITERQPIGSIAVDGAFDLVDPAGIVVERTQVRTEGLPLIDVGGADVDSTAFRAAIEVLVALPDSVLTQLDSITATTLDDVRLRLIDRGPEIIWGSADDSDFKARVLENALAQNFPGVSQINVSAPGQLTVR